MEVCPAIDDIFHALLLIQQNSLHLAFNIMHTTVIIMNDNNSQQQQ